MSPLDKDQQTSVSPKSRFRKLCRVVFLGGGLLFVFGGLFSIGAYLLWSYPAAMETRAELEKIRQEWGVGSLEEMNAFFDLPEGQKDLVPHLNKAWRDYSTVKESLPNPDPTYAEEDSELEDYLSWPDIPQVTAKLNPANPNWGQVSTAEKFLKEFEEITRQVERMAEMGGGFRIPGDWARGGVLGDGEMGSIILAMRDLHRILIAKNRMSLCKGDVEGASEATFAALSLIRGMDRTEVIYQLTRSSVLSAVLPSVVSTFPYMRDGDLIKIQEILSELDFRSAWKYALVSEWVAVGSQIQQGNHVSRLSNSFFGRVLLALGRPHDLARLYGNANRFLAVLDRPWKEIIKLLGTSRFSHRHQLLRAGAIFQGVLYYNSSDTIWLYAAGSGSAFDADARVQAAIAVAGIERFHRKHGRLPANLEELSVSYLPSEVRDPYTQGALKYVIGENGYIVYSLGKDGEDDGGVDWELEIESCDDVAIGVPRAGLSASSRVLDKITEPVLALPARHGPVLDTVFSPDGKLLVSGCYDGEIQVRDASSGKLLQGLAGHKGPVACVAFSPDGAILLSGGGGWNREDDRFGEIFSWNTRTWEKNAVKNIDMPITAIAFSPKGTEALVGTSGREVDAIYSAMGFSRRLDPRTLSWGGDPVVVKANVNAVSFSPDGESAGFLLSPYFSSNPGKILDVRNGKRFRLDGTYLSDELRARGVEDEHMDGNLLDPPVLELSRQEITHGTAGFTNLDFSPDSKLMAFGGYGGRVEIWAHRASSGPGEEPADGLEEGEEPSTGKLLRILAGHSRAVTSVAFSPDGKSLLSGSGDHTIRLWDVQDGRCLASFERHSLGVNAVAFSPDGKRIASASTDGSVRVWEVPSTE